MSHKPLIVSSIQNNIKPIIVANRKIIVKRKDSEGGPIPIRKNREHKNKSNDIVSNKKVQDSPLPKFWKSYIKKDKKSTNEYKTCMDSGESALIPEDIRTDFEDKKEVSILTVEDFVELKRTVEESYHMELHLYLKRKQLERNLEDEKWINDVIKSGTQSDKIAALALRIQDSPFHHLDTLKELMRNAKEKDQRKSALAMEALKDLFLINLLPDRRLLEFTNSAAFLNPLMTMKIALYIWYEGELKQLYESFISALEDGIKSTLSHFKIQCIRFVSELLLGKPEQEGRLLNLLVSKLGDHEGTVSSKSIECLKNVINQHPAMKLVIIREVRQLIYRPSVKLRTILNSVIFLHQIPLKYKKSEQDSTNETVCAQLVECYMSLFDRAINEKEAGSRLLSALLMGINIALPCLQSIESIQNSFDSLFRIVHNAVSFTTSTQALMLLSNFIKPEAENSQNESFKSSNEESSEINKSFLSRYYRALYAKLLSDQVLSRSRNSRFFNLLYNSIKKDPSPYRAAAFIKRLTICALYGTPPVAAGVLYLISEIIRSRPELKPLLDISYTNTTNTEKEVQSTKSSVDKPEETYHWFDSFDASKRAPEFSCQTKNFPILWENTLLKQHFHPSVQAFATSFLEPPHHIMYTGDPTLDFSVMAFLNRFAYKNPKKMDTTDSQQKSINISRTRILEEDPINLAELHTKSIVEVEPEKHFFHKFFGDRNRLISEGRLKLRKVKKLPTDYDEGEVLNDGNASIDPDEEMSIDSNEKDKSGHDEEDEDEIDAFANKLALNLIRSNADNAHFDDEEFDEDVDVDDDDDDDDDDVFDPDEGVVEHENPDGDDAQTIEGSDMASTEVDFRDVGKKNKQFTTENQNLSKALSSRKRSKKSSSVSDFADADDFEEEIELALKGIRRGSE